MHTSRLSVMRRQGGASRMPARSEWTTLGRCDRARFRSSRNREEAADLNKATPSRRRTPLHLERYRSSSSHQGSGESAICGGERVDVRPRTHRARDWVDMTLRWRQGPRANAQEAGFANAHAYRRASPWPQTRPPANQNRRGLVAAARPVQRCFLVRGCEREVGDRSSAAQVAVCRHVDEQAICRVER